MIIKLLLPVAICIFALVIILALIISLGGKNKSRPRQRAKCPATKSPRYKSLAEFALEVDKDPTAIDINMRAVIVDLADGLENACKEAGSEYCRNVLKDTIAALNRIAKASIADKRKPQIGSVSDLADLIEDKRAVISPSIKAVFTEIYDYCVIANKCAETEDIANISYDIERIIYPNGITASQEEAAARRRAEKEVFKAKKTALHSGGGAK